MDNTYLRQILTQMQTLNENFSVFVQTATGWYDSFVEKWEFLLDFLPAALWFLVALVGAKFVIYLFFPKWGGL